MENVTKNTNKQNELNDHAPKLSIQQAFKKFQKQKFYQLKLNKYLKNIQKDRTDPEFKQQLRQKFIETAKKYIGVPYAQKFHQPGDLLYDAPLYIDCCALIRQCVFDLRQQFGFTLAKWNQAYQFDMLPNQNLTQGDLKPGDLIFYSATYHNPKLKPFPHKMVHVQIYLGEGKSIGARWQKGTIQLFDSYKFQSTLYYDIEFHYRSIDTWLEGKFQNHCNEHKWLDDRANEWLSDKYSVFADPSLDDINLTTDPNNQIHEKKNIFIGKGNNSKLIKQYFDEKQGKYNIMPQKQQFSNHFYFKWVQTTGEVDFYSFKQGQQIVNHIANICMISSKLQLLKTLQQLQLQRINNKKLLTLHINDFVPKTYRLNVMSDEIQFLNDTNSGIWIYKPRNLNQGKGIRIISDIQAFKHQFIKSKKFYLGEFSLNNMLHFKPQLLENHNVQIENNKYSELSHDGLVQHYIRPLLVDGKKFDIRCYMLINCQPNIVLYNEGYLRLTIQSYSEDDMQNQQKLSIHLTNNCYQHKHKDYKTKKQTTIAHYCRLKQEVGQEKYNKLTHQIKRILTVTYAAAKRKLLKKKGTYQLLGVDILVDNNIKPYLLEVNTNPALFTDTKVQTQIIPKVVKSSLQFALNIFQSPSNESQIISQAISNGFKLLYSERGNFVYNGCNQQGEIINISQDKTEITLDINGLNHTEKIGKIEKELQIGQIVRLNELQKKQQ